VTISLSLARLSRPSGNGGTGKLLLLHAARNLLSRLNIQTPTHSSWTTTFGPDLSIYSTDGSSLILPTCLPAGRRSTTRLHVVGRLLGFTPSMAVTSRFTQYFLEFRSRKDDQDRGRGERGGRDSYWHLRLVLQPAYTRTFRDRWYFFPFGTP
jgi:hypothetical protein